ncbi:MAG: RDD family protein [Nitrososphaerota archaeon]
MESTPWTQQGELAQAHAGFASRTIAFIIDLAIMAVILLLAGVFVQLMGLYFPLNKLLAQVAGVGAGEALRAPLALASTVVLFAGYPIICWAMIGQTPGKWVLGLRVVRTDGRRLTIWRGVLRYLAYWLSALPLFLGFIWIIVDAKRQGWHDKIADTCVIYTMRPQSATRRARPA